MELILIRWTFFFFSSMNKLCIKCHGVFDAFCVAQEMSLIQKKFVKIIYLEDSTEYSSMSEIELIEK